MKKFLVTSLSAVVVLSVLSACAPKKRVTNPAQPAGDTSVEDVTGLKAAPAPATDAQLDIPQKIVSENSNDLSKGNRLGVTITRPEAGDIRVETLNQGEGKVETSVVNTKTGVPGKVHFSELSTNGAARNVVAEILNDEGKLVKIEVFSWNEKSLKVVGKLNVKDMPEQDLGITDASFTVIRYTEDGAVAPFDTLEINKIVDESKKTSTKPLEVTSTIKNEKIKTLFHNIPEIKDKEGNTLSLESPTVTYANNNFTLLVQLVDSNKNNQGQITVTVEMPQQKDAPVFPSATAATPAPAPTAAPVVTTPEVEKKEKEDESKATQVHGK